MIYNTEKRAEITAFLSKNPNKVFSMEEICAHVSPDGSAKSTVYRIISKMTDEGSVKRISDEDGRRAAYQYIGFKTCSEHLHLKCKECGRLIHLDEDMTKMLEDQILTSRSFKIDVGATISGKCELCLGGAEK